MSVIEVTKDNFKDEVISSDKPVLIDFWASWCGPCKMLSPVVDEIAEENNGFKVCKINVDENPELASEYKVASIPTLMVFKNGKLINTSVGVRSKEDILKMVNT